MINAIIFDFGDVFINLDKQATQDQLQALGLKAWNEEFQPQQKQSQQQQHRCQNCSIRHDRTFKI